MAKVSVIMGIYNCSSTLQEALDSLYRQTFQDFVIIMCDDGSTDNTYVIASMNAKNHDNIILIRNEKNLKLAATLNHCLGYVKTDYVARMDGDDISMPSRFEKQLGFLEGHDEYAFVSSPMLYFDDNGVWAHGKAIPEPQPNDFRRGSAPFCHAPAMIRTEALLNVGGYTTGKATERMEDYDLWAKLMISGYRGYNIQEHLYAMRNDRSAFSRRKFSDRIRGYLTASSIKKRLNINHPYLSGVPDLMKAFVPGFIIRKMHRISKNV